MKPTVFSVIEHELCHQGYSVIDNFLNEQDYADLTKNIIEYSHSFKAAGVGKSKQQLNEIRKDSILWIDDLKSGKGIESYQQSLTQLMAHLNQTLFLCLVEFEAHFARYEPGAYYKKHIDQFQKNNQRRISSVYYLNNQWMENHGGELILYPQSSVKKISPIGNRFVCFTSDLLHEVCVAQQTRYSIAAWFKTR